MSLANLGEPVTLVRSPTFTKFVSGRIVRGSRPLNRLNGSEVGTTRGDKPRTASLMTRMCAGVVPQQPPTRLSQPLRAQSLSCGARVSGVSGKPVGRRGFGRPAFGY